MTTARTIIRRAMQKAGILTKTETPSGDEANDALYSLNGILESWANDSMLIYARAWENFTLTGGTGEYTIGASQMFNTVRPTLIVEAHVRQGTIDSPIQIISDEVYNSYIQMKTSPGLPYWLNYDNGYPAAKIRLWPVPTQSDTLYILSEKPLTALSLDTTVSLPPGWERALIYNLAVELTPEYGQELSGEIVEIAKTSRAAIRRSIIKNRSMDAMPEIGATNNIYTGYRNR